MFMKMIKNILFWISTVCLVLMIIMIAVPRLFGVEFRAVISGSMEPEIPVGSLVVIVPAKAGDIKVGDDITFISASEKIVTHRVINIDREKNEFITWGIANDPSAIDAPNSYENILGVVRLHLPFVGRIFVWFSALYGKIITVTAIIATFIISTIIGVWTEDRKEKNEAPEAGKKRRKRAFRHQTEAATEKNDVDAADEVAHETLQVEPFFESLLRNEEPFKAQDAYDEVPDMKFSESETPGDEVPKEPQDTLDDLLARSEALFNVRETTVEEPDAIAARDEELYKIFKKMSEEDMEDK